MFSIEFSASARKDLRYLHKSKQTLIVEEVEEQLIHEPLRETRNRKPLRPNDLSSWELRVADFRVFYDVNEEVQEVTIKAVGWKEHNKLIIRGKEYPL
jgi:mRNA-degrading endonuclease RelE of RelBE toxin-antitoxin system